MSKTNTWRTVRILVEVTVKGDITNQQIVSAAHYTLTGQTYHFLHGMISENTTVGSIIAKDYARVLRAWRRHKSKPLGGRLPIKNLG